ncbi:3-hydroxybutyryl-CoA dehydrogenase [Geodia barretti]|uniref:3-hydroxybutyryl-CoA dehydrogenase n=1 Tax=Geodia barretti TaxID=519541 RepID=A0AA35R799_GEOBA|nr:3-hydroxybutyryl-CoA dehydrogenase [Geodia barretti]
MVSARYPGPVTSPAALAGPLPLCARRPAGALPTGRSVPVRPRRADSGYTCTSRGGGSAGVDGHELDIRRVGVLGGGTMGSGIAEVCARAGLDTRVVEIDATAVEQVQKRIETSLGKAQARNRISAEDHDAAQGRLSYAHDVADMADRDLVIEAPRTLLVLPSNTSSIAIVDLATATGRPQRVVGMHFFNPAPVQPLVEIVRSVASDEQVVAALAAFTTEVLGKQVIRCEDRAGFVVNRLLVPYLLSAIALADTGQASP